MESLVVPAMGETITLFSPVISFMMDDFPTLGLPITAMDMASASSSKSTSGKASTILSNTSPNPNIFADDIAMGSPMPSS